MLSKERRQIFKRVKELLTSDDIEMVRLGATLLPTCRKHKDWKTVLDAARNYKWYYILTKKDIVIVEFDIKDWFSSNIPSNTYKIYTGQGGANLLQQAMQQQFQQKYPNQGIPLQLKYEKKYQTVVEQKLKQNQIRNEKRKCSNGKGHRKSP